MALFLSLPMAQEFKAQDDTVEVLKVDDVVTIFYSQSLKRLDAVDVEDGFVLTSRIKMETLEEAQAYAPKMTIV